MTDDSAPWISVPGEPHNVRRCRQHPEVGSFGPSTVVRVADVPVPTFLYGQCHKCWLIVNRNPKAADIGLEERPEWWSVRGAGLHCDEHDRDMAIDEACRKCVDEDAADE